MSFASRRKPDSPPAPPSRRLGIIGCIVGLLALIAAVLPHWLLPVIFPPPPFEQVMVEKEHKLKDLLIGHKPAVESHMRIRDEGLSDRLEGPFSTAAISLGLVAIVLAVVALIYREERLLAGVAAALGTVAIAIEIAYVLMPFVLLALVIILYLGT